MSNDFVFTSESVCAGHPDKLCDRISDAIVDHFLRQDPNARLTSECAVASGVLFIACNHQSQATLDVATLARRVMRRVGYPREVFDIDHCAIMSSINEQPVSCTPPDPRVLTDAQLDTLTARHHATVFGYACDQTGALMPLPIWLAHRLVARMDSAEVHERLPYLLPDGRSQVGVEYREGIPSALHSVTLVASQSQADRPTPAQLRSDLIEQVIEPVLRDQYLSTDTELYINPEGPFIGGGPATHAGLTGRKTAVDSYGEYARHSGAALSGKGLQRIDRVGAYVARYLAKNTVAAGLARECEVQLSYAIGQAGPISLRVRTFGTAQLPDTVIKQRLERFTDLRLGAIVRDFGLQALPGRHPDGFYERLAVYGQMGREDLDAPWEQTGRAEQLTVD